MSDVNKGTGNERSSATLIVYYALGGLLLFLIVLAIGSYFGMFDQASVAYEGFD